VGLGNQKVEEKIVKILEEFITSRQKPYEEWKSSNWLAHELGRVIGEELNRTHAKLQSLLPQLVRRICEDSRYMEVFLSFDEIVSDYSRIIDHIVEIFSYPDTETISEASEALEAFLQGKESREWLKYRLGMIVSKFNEEFKEGL
jgi:iron-sulfur cluster repair protein YtfE (RIC family)